MIGKRFVSKEKGETRDKRVLGPGDFPIGSPQSRAAARLRLQCVGVAGACPSYCICFPENEPLFFAWPCEAEIAARVMCPLHGERFKRPALRKFIPQWRRETEPLRRLGLSLQYRKAWDASFPPGLWPAEEVLVDGKIVLRLKDGTILPTG